MARDDAGRARRRATYAALADALENAEELESAESINVGKPLSVVVG